MASDDGPPTATISLPPGFRIEPQDGRLRGRPANSPTPDPPLGVLANFTGTFMGNGFNTIFRPFSGQGSIINVLELNLTNETLSFSPPIGKVPNRGLAPQQDICLNGVSYVQAVNDVTNPGSGLRDQNPSQIHIETGFWMYVPSTTNPALGNSLVRMGSIPHGTTINAQSFEPVNVVSGPPDISPKNITPFSTSDPSQPKPQASQTAATPSQNRLPVDLSTFIAAGTITQDILNDPTEVLRNDLQGQDILQTSTFNISTAQMAPDIGGGTDNIAFLLGAPVGTAGAAQTGPNADAVQMNATFWVEVAQYTITVPPRQSQDPATIIPGTPAHPGAPVPSFAVAPPQTITSPTTIQVQSIQIQYRQTVNLVFGPTTWPHMSVATLVPQDPVPVPATAFA
ncbi:hypothetical protein MMC21_001285 [Puttea exsequens]|nr:hypothetical protein [Puttea exsequens]